MKLRSYKDLPVNKELYLGPSHQQFCNRYLRRGDNIIEVQNIYRYGKPSNITYMTEQEFNKWLR